MSNGMARRRERLAREQDGICPECTLPLPEGLAGTEVDHIIPKVCGGPDVAWNRQLVHFKCNRTKRFKITDRARELAAEYGVIVHPPIFASAIANRPLTRHESLRADYMRAIFTSPPDRIRPHQASAPRRAAAKLTPALAGLHSELAPA